MWTSFFPLFLLFTAEAEEQIGSNDEQTQLVTSTSSRQAYPQSTARLVDNGTPNSEDQEHHQDNLEIEPQEEPPPLEGKQGAVIQKLQLI